MVDWLAATLEIIVIFGFPFIWIMASVATETISQLLRQVSTRLRSYRRREPPPSVNRNWIDDPRRRDKIDDTLVFLMGSIGILFGLLQSFVRASTLPQFIIPVGLLGWALPFYFGYVRGAVGDSMADRYRGWIFLVIGSGLYGLVVVQEEVTRSLKIDPQWQWAVALAFTVPTLFAALQMKRFRSFVLGPGFPPNPVLSRAAFDTVKVAVVITIAGGYLALTDSLSSWDLIVIGPLTLFGAYFMYRSNHYAKRIYWPNKPVEKKGRLHDHRKARLAYKLLSIATWTSYVATVPPALLIRFNISWGHLSQVELEWLILVLLVLTGVLGLPTLVLRYLAGTRQDFDFEGPFLESPPVDEPI